MRCPFQKTEPGGHLMYSPQIEQDFRLPQTFRARWTSTRAPTQLPFGEKENIAQLRKQRRACQRYDS